MNTSTETNTDIKKQPTAWNLFMKRVSGLTGEGMQFSSFLKTRKDMAVWTDAEILAAMPEWRTAKELEGPKEAKEPKEPKEPKVAKASKKTEVPTPSEDPQAEVPAKVKKVKVMAPVVAPVPAPAPASATSTLEFHLNEAKKKVVTATNIAEKAEIEAKRANERAEEAMKAALDLKAKAAVALATATEARAVVGECQKDVDAKAAEFEKAAAAASASASAAAAAAAAGSTEPDSPSDPIHLRRKKIPKHIKTLVWNKYMGSDVAQANCVSCRDTKITNRSFHCGHVIAESKGGDMTINNLRPICDACNGSMGVQSMNEFTKEFFGWVV